MTRIRSLLTSTVVALGVAALSGLTLAQPPGGGPPGGPGGPGGRGGRGGGFGGMMGGPGGMMGGMMGGPGGFGGRGGGPGGNIWGLLDYTSVQEDLKLTDKQKEQLKAAKEQVDALRKSAFPNRGNRNGGPGAGPGGQNDNAQPGQGGTRRNRNNRNGGNTNPGGGVSLQPVSFQPPQIQGQGGGRRGRGGQGGQGAPGGQGGPGGFDPAMFQQMRENMQRIQNQTEAIYAKILTKSQIARLHEIDLRRQGPTAVLRPDIAEKLNIDEDTMTLIRQDMQAAVQPQFEAMRKAMEKFQTPDPNGGRPRFDFNAAREYMNTDEGKAQQTEMQKQGQETRTAIERAIGKHLSKNQKEKFNKMLGKPFDVTTLEGPPPGKPAGSSTDAAAKSNGTATKSDANADSSDTTTKSTPAKKGTRKSTTKRRPTS